MTILGALLKKGIQLGKKIERKKVKPGTFQKRELRKLLNKAEETAFGKKYQFSSILKKFGILSSRLDKGAYYQLYKKNVPTYNYNTIFDEWWHKTLEGQPDITWPGHVKYFALSSGTSEASTKHIPITKDMLRQIKRTSVRQIMQLANYDLSKDIFDKGILMLGGSTELFDQGTYFEGDLSGITASKIPYWFQHFYKPGKKIASTRDWNEKLEEITLNAKDWDIGYIVGVPAWIQIMMEKIIAHYNVNNIHDIWPNLEVYCHGGVSFEPYRKGFNKLLGRPLKYIETYLASEGFIAFQTHPDRHSMRLVLNNGIFYEFVPFDDINFTADGEMIENPQTYMIDDVEEDKNYALLLSTCAGTWRYLIGDVVKFTNVRKAEIIITGRTKHYLSLCGEHLSVDNMNKAIQLTSDDLNIEIKEFAVAGIPHGTMFAHKWYIGTDAEIDSKLLEERIDSHLKIINDDYRTERIAALKEIIVEVIPTQHFYGWMEQRGKVGGQNKFPRVLKKPLQEEWELYLKAHN